MDFITQLKTELPLSNSKRQKELAEIIVANDIDLNKLLPLIFEDQKISSRFF